MLFGDKENPKELGTILKNYGWLILPVIAWIGALCGVVAVSQYQIDELFTITDKHTVQIDETQKNENNQSTEIAVLSTKMDVVSSNVMDIKKYLRVPG